MTRSLSCSYVSPSSQPAALRPATKAVGKELLSFGPGQVGPRAHVNLAQVESSRTGSLWSSATIAVSCARSRSLE